MRGVYAGFNAGMVFRQVRKTFRHIFWRVLPCRDSERSLVEKYFDFGFVSHSSLQCW